MGGRKLGDSTLPPLETTAVRTVGKGKGKGKGKDYTPGILGLYDPYVPPIVRGHFLPLAAAAGSAKC